LHGSVGRQDWIFVGRRDFSPNINPYQNCDRPPGVKRTLTL
jgi:hypothetical protein